jgi:predicted metal-dependent hydrolase
VKLIIPEDFSQDDISRLLSQKEVWIKKQQSFFSQEQINPVKLEKGQILLFGEAYQPDFDLTNTVLLE